MHYLCAQIIKNVLIFLSQGNWKYGSLENKKWENIKKIGNFESLKKCEIGNMENVEKIIEIRGKTLYGGDKCKNPKGYTME